MSTALTHTTTADYQPPRNFAEYLERHPGHVRGYLCKTFGLRGADLDDAVQDVYVHLLSIPAKSMHTHHLDRVSIYREPVNPTPGAFLSFMGCLMRRYMLRTRFSPTANRVAENAVTFVDLPAKPYNVHNRIWFDSVLSRATSFDPFVARVAVAVSIHRSKQAAAMSLGVSIGRVEHCLRVLGKIASGIPVDTHNRPRRSKGQPKPERDQKLQRKRRRERERQQSLEQFRMRMRKV